MIDFVDIFKTFILGALAGHAIGKWKIDHRKFNVLENRIDRLETWVVSVEREVEKAKKTSDENS
jgi:hypothetical protein